MSLTELVGLIEQVFALNLNVKIFPVNETSEGRVVIRVKQTDFWFILNLSSEYQAHVYSPNKHMNSVLSSARDTAAAEQFLFF